jgi:LmbE family N-acetylglucosaminyl deacetylase
MENTMSYRDFAAFADVKRLLVVAAHPDDLESMCGGTVALLAAHGVEIFSVNCTLGDIGSQEENQLRPALAARRIEETRVAAGILGLQAHFHLEHHDGELVPDLTLRAQIARLYRITGADTLFTFDPYWTGQIHPDHRAAGQAALDAYMPAKMPLYQPAQLKESGAALGKIERIFLFATDRDPDIYVDVDTVYDQKVAATLAHQSQFPNGVADVEWMRELDRSAAAILNAGAAGNDRDEITYAERFKALRLW